MLDSNSGPIDPLPEARALKLPSQPIWLSEEIIWWQEMKRPYGPTPKAGFGLAESNHIYFFCVQQQSNLPKGD